MLRKDAGVPIPDQEQKVPAHPLEKEIQTATPLPSPLVSIVHGYLSTPPTQLVVDQIHANLNAFKSLWYQHDWKGVSISIDRHFEFDCLRNSSRANLYKVELNGIIFTGSQQNHSAEAIKVRSYEEAKTELENWYSRHYSPYHSLYRDYIIFDEASLTGAKFENLLCASFSFKKSILTNTSFKSSLLTGANFSEAKMQNADLSFSYGALYCYWRYNGLHNGSSSGEFTAGFKRTDLTKAKLCNSNFNQVVFNRTILDEAQFNEGSFISAEFYGCSMQQADLTKANFSMAKFADYNRGDQPVSVNLSGAIAMEANFTDADFTNTNLQNIILIGANLTGAKMKEAHLQGAQLTDADFTLDQFTEEQILSFHYPDENARFYIKAIFDYMMDNDKDKAKHEKGFERARKLILSFIHGQNELLTGFLLTGNLPGEGAFSSFFSSSESNENSLRARLQKVKDSIDKLVNEPSVTIHTLRRSSSEEKS